MPTEIAAANVAEPILSGTVSCDPGSITVVGAMNEDRLVPYLIDFYRKAQVVQRGPATLVFGSRSFLKAIVATPPGGVKLQQWLVELPLENPRFSPPPKDPMIAAMGRYNSSFHVCQTLFGDKSCFTAKEVNDQAAVGKIVAGGALAPTVDALFGRIVTELLSDPSADVQWLLLRSVPNVHVYFEGRAVTADFVDWWKRQPHLEQPVSEMAPPIDSPVPILFGLEAQGHIPTIEAALDGGVIGMRSGG
ncbi:hypothetical protein HFN89_02570 [Rhizobium laguerreae]|nr:hypothetical protein [Rhizobium laguerreae]